jgi:hypothetical protein
LRELLKRFFGSPFLEVTLFRFSEIYPTKGLSIEIDGGSIALLCPCCPSSYRNRHGTQLPYGIGRLRPARLSGSFCSLPPIIPSHLSGASFATFAAQSHCGGVLSLFFWRRLPILYLASGDIDHQLGGLVEVARALGVLRHAETMTRPMRPFHGLSRPATIKLTHYPASPAGESGEGTNAESN